MTTIPPERDERPLVARLSAVEMVSHACATVVAAQTEIEGGATGSAYYVLQQLEDEIDSWLSWNAAEAA